ncbi:MAG: response regulator [Treponema sp.]|jgi:PAS domain S-box-containing protein|nr:response regulator [Treponema sp.]
MKKFRDFIVSNLAGGKHNALQNSFLKMFFDNSPDIIMILDKNEKLVYCSKIFLEKSGLKSFEKPYRLSYHDVFSHFLSTDHILEVNNIFNTSKMNKKPVIFEQTIDFASDGKNRRYEIHYTPMFRIGSFQGAFIMFNDLTNAIEAQEHTEYASKAKSEFLANMSHEIRTPLNAIIGMTTIARDSDAERKNHCLDKIESASIHLLGIINDMLDMSKIEENRFELSLVEFDFFAMIERIMNVFKFRLNEKSQKLVLEKDPMVPQKLITDEQRLTQVINQLISNAIKFTPDCGDIVFSIRRLENPPVTPPDFGKDNFCCLEIRITDTGIGIPKDQQEKLFQTFYQADSSFSRKFGGTGLGLTISKKIVELMHGDIWIESEERKGASFIFTICAKVPGDVSPVVSDSVSGTVCEAVQEDTIDFTGKKILLAEDVEINREIVLSVLEPLGLTILEAEDGQIAYDMYRADPDSIDLIFMDIHMPAVNGYDSTKLIRAFEAEREKTKNSKKRTRPEGVPIIAMTANVFQEDVKKCLASGMDGHVSKPVDFSVVIELLQRYL